MLVSAVMARTGPDWAMQVLAACNSPALCQRPLAMTDQLPSKVEVWFAQQ